MKTIGGWLFFFGIGSIVLHFLGREFAVLAWIENWGPEAGWGIRIGMAVVGAVLWFIGKGKDKTAPAPAG